MTKQEFLLIESYALGYLAHKLDRTLPRSLCLTPWLRKGSLSRARSKENGLDYPGFRLAASGPAGLIRSVRPGPLSSCDRPGRQAFRNQSTMTLLRRCRLSETRLDVHRR